tara:strand:- start:343 stop:498 length:156 start_codon:yes stop_codon:yes gene_type:complete
MGVVMSTRKTKKAENEMLNHLLKDIVKANGGNINSEDKNALLRSWLKSIGG